MVTQQPQKQSVKCNVKELLSKFETSPTSTPDEPHFPAPATDHRHNFLNQESSPASNMNFSSITPTLSRKMDSHSFTERNTDPIFTSASPNLSRKECGFTSDTPKLSRRSDPSTHNTSNSALPPCVRARLAKAARNKLANSTALSVSLDEGQFLSSSGQDEGQLVRVQTSPDINEENGEMSAENILERNVSTSEITEKTKALASADFDDPQRRERIERYKEERRLFLREKYRSESFRGERDEILQRLKQKTVKTASSPITDEPMDMSRSITSCERVRSNSFRSTEDERERDIMSQSMSSSERLSGTLERPRERRFGRTSTSPKERDSEQSSTSSPEHTLLHLERRSKRGSDDSDSSRHRRSSTSDKQKFNGSSVSPEKSPVTCVTVRQRLGSDRMTVNVGPIDESENVTSRMRSHFEEKSKPTVIRGGKGHISVSETKRNFSSSEVDPAVELRRTAGITARLTKSYDGSVRKRSTDKSEVSSVHPDVEVRLSSRGELTQFKSNY